MMVEGLIGETIDEKVDCRVESEEKVCQLHWNGLPERQPIDKINAPDFKSSLQKIRPLTSQKYIAFLSITV